jgi:hypothetical protein
VLYRDAAMNKVAIHIAHHIFLSGCLLNKHRLQTRMNRGFGHLLPRWHTDLSTVSVEQGVWLLVPGAWPAQGHYHQAP